MASHVNNVYLNWSQSGLPCETTQGVNMWVQRVRATVASHSGMLHAFCKPISNYCRMRISLSTFSIWHVLRQWLTQHCFCHSQNASRKLICAFSGTEGFWGLNVFFVYCILCFVLQWGRNHVDSLFTYSIHQAHSKITQISFFLFSWHHFFTKFCNLGKSYW